MGLVKLAREIWRKYATDGVPSSGVNQPDKGDIIAWGTMLETLINGGSPGFAYLNLATLNGDLVHGAGTTALVYNDASPSNNGLYSKVGASGSGSWLRISDLPNAVVALTVTGGTGDAIVATATESPTSPGAKLYLMTPTAANTTATTIAVNGAAPVAIKNAFGVALAANSLLSGSQVLMAWQTDHYQLLLSANPDASAFTAACASSATAAAASATAAAASASALGNQVMQFDTRALAIAATIPGGVNFIRTLAYDSSFLQSSGALFKRVSGVPFLDTYPLTGTIAGGSGYVNGTYRGVPLGGGVGIGLSATVTVAGGAVTAIDHKGCPGAGYAVSDVLTAVNTFIGGSGSGFTYTIATISTPTASFTNTGSSLWQYIAEGAFPHVNQFGAKPDYVSSDSGVTNNFTPFQNALFFAGGHGGTNSDSGGYAGDRVLVGRGSYFLNSSPAASLITPFGVYLEGVGGSTLKIADAFDSATHFITLGDPNSHTACFRSGLRNLTLFCKRGISASAGTAMVYTNSTQDGGGLDNVYIYAGQRAGTRFETGYGGASTVSFDNVSISWEGSNAGIMLNYGTTIINFNNLILGGPSSGTNNTVNGIEMTGSGGMYNFKGVHFEFVPTGFLVNLTGSAMVLAENVTGGNGVTNVVSLASTNTNGNFAIRQATKNGATTLVLNGQSGGSSRSGDVTPKDGIVSFNP